MASYIKVIQVNHTRMALLETKKVLMVLQKKIEYSTNIISSLICNKMAQDHVEIPTFTDYRIIRELNTELQIVYLTDSWTVTCRS